jgi:DNA-directed RNA polymerase subunit RPC12/RpoP
MYYCAECGYVFSWSPLAHWGPACPYCGGRHSKPMPGA